MARRLVTDEMMGWMNTSMRVRRAWLGVLVIAGALALVGCVEEPDAPTDEQAQGLAPGAGDPPVQPEVVGLNTFDANTVEIDRLGNGPGDANVFSATAAPGGDPADNTAHAQLPTGATGTYIDWNDHAADAANHRIIDDVKSDSDIFTHGDCIGAGQVTKKFDANAMLIASTDKAVQLGWSINDDNGSYSWTLLFTKLEPSLEPGSRANGCKANEFFLTYDLTGPNGSTGDVAVRGVFTPGGANLRVFRAKADFADVPGPDAHDVFNSTYWQEIGFAPGEVVAAVNSTMMRPGAILDPNLVKYDTLLNAPNGGVALEPNVFSEGSVPLSTFTGGSACGATFFTSGSTQSSQSGPSDHKDFVRVAAVNLGDLSVTSRLAPTCDEDIFYEVSEVLGFDGQPLPTSDYTCDWEFFDSMGTSVDTVTGSCKGVWTPPSAGTYSADITVVQTGGLQCESTTSTGQVTSYGAMSATADVAGSCTAGTNGNESSMTYSGTVSGGSGSYGYAWMFGADDAMGCPACAASPNSASDLPSAGTPGTFQVTLANNDYRGDLEVTDTGLTNAVTDAGVATTCKATASDVDTTYTPITVSLSLTSGGATCSDTPPISSDAATWTSVVSGGSGMYTLDWSNNTWCTDGATSCTIDPSDSTYCATETVQLNVTDDSGLCAGVDSETESYAKITSVTVSDN